MRFFCVFLVFLFFWGCGGPEEAIVEYKVTGTCEVASIICYNETGGMDHIKNVFLPWSRKMKLKPGATLSISANNEMPYGSITITVYINDRQVKEITSNGPYTSASFSGILGD
jgi:hypothetical protein